MKKWICSSLLLLLVAGCQTSSPDSGQQDVEPKPEPWVLCCSDDAALVAGKVISNDEYGFYFKADNGSSMFVNKGGRSGEVLKKYLSSDQYVLVKTRIFVTTTGGALTGDPEQDVIRSDEHYVFQSVLKVDDNPIFPINHKSLCNQ